MQPVCPLFSSKILRPLGESSVPTQSCSPFTSPLPRLLRHIHPRSLTLSQVIPFSYSYKQRSKTTDKSFRGEGRSKNVSIMLRITFSDALRGARGNHSENFDPDPPSHGPSVQLLTAQIKCLFIRWVRGPTPAD